MLEEGREEEETVEGERRRGRGTDRGRRGECEARDGGKRRKRSALPLIPLCCSGASTHWRRRLLAPHVEHTLTPP